MNKFEQLLMDYTVQVRETHQSFIDCRDFARRVRSGEFPDSETSDKVYFELSSVWRSNLSEQDKMLAELVNLFNS